MGLAAGLFDAYVHADAVAVSHLDAFVGRRWGDAVEGLDCDLQTTEERTGAVRIKAPCGQRAQDLHEGELDSSGVFDGGKSERGLVVAAAVLPVGVELLVVVAVKLAAEGDGFALGSSGHDVTAFGGHGVPFDPLSLNISGRKYSVFFGLTKTLRAKDFQDKELGTEILECGTYRPSDGARELVQDEISFRDEFRVAKWGN
jgi:hypothetical protein